MLRWFSPTYWRQLRACWQQRERLALLLWPYLDDSARRADDAEPLRLLVRMVRAIENGHDEFRDDQPARLLWQRANAEDSIQQAAGALRTARLQLQGVSAVSGLQLEPVGRKQLKPLRDKMNADALDNAFGNWLHAPLTLPVVSALFLFSGWLFNSIFFSHFGLPVGRYFGLSDYLAASIEGLVPACIAVGFTFVTQWLMRHRMRQQTLQNQLGSNWPGLLLTMLMFVVAVLVIPKLIPEPAVQRLMLIYLSALAIPILAIPLLIRFSKRPARDTLLLNFVVIYAAVIWFTAEMRYVSVSKQKDKRTEVVLTSAPQQVLPWKVVAGNSLYLFLLNEQNELMAVPVQQVLSVHYVKTGDEDAPAAAAVMPGSVSPDTERSETAKPAAVTSTSTSTTTPAQATPPPLRR
ncbi:hypothetical protein HPT27_05830 [Permianibacter sp. IMCC34836]|uniref:hypothetical protein n=1 Tax=Permianibacter fluminis TaxID=2738515 RepID=UPI00155796EF|nr:hypothetical protein [Permianibacter fluminis]NQD36536.1 hypothetical protein [Permianibacter fluminis]